MTRAPNEQHGVDGSAEGGTRPEVVDGFNAYAPGLARQGPGFDPSFYAQLAALEAGNFWFRARNALVLWAFGRHFPQARRYLEVGCGTGYVLSAICERFPRLQACGSEIFVEGLAFAARRAPRADLFQMDARDMPFTAAFDVIGAFDVLEHIEDDAGVLAQMHRALGEGGGVILTVPQHPGLWSRQDEFAHHVRRYARGELERKLEAAGFTVRWTSSFVSLLLPALVVSRLSRRADATAATDHFAEFKLPAWLNALLLAIMRVESAMIRAGIRFPIGGSRMVVACKAST
jgi:SAM-dependent methyltransferase